MRVTKTVREYIEKQVALKFPKTEDEILADEVSKIVSQANDEINRRITKASKEIVLSVGAAFGITEEMARNQVLDSYPRYSYSAFNAPIAMKSNTARTTREKTITEKVNDIIVTLELGGTKADLEKMLAQI